MFDTDIRQDAILIGGILSYTGYPCNVTCYNQGVCFPRFNNFKCKCLEGFSGKFCQHGNLFLVNFRKLIKILFYLANGRKIRNCNIKKKFLFAYYNIFLKKMPKLIH